MENADELYTQRTKENEEEFLENLKKGEKTPPVEQRYKINAKKIRKRYQKELTKELNAPIPKKQKKQETTEETKKFTVEKINLETTWKDKLRFKVETKKFRYSRKLNNFLRKRPFNILKYLYFRLKYLLKDINLNLSILGTRIKRIILNIIFSLKETFNKTVSLIKTLLKKINIFKGKDGKKETKETSKKESSESDK